MIGACMAPQMTAAELASRAQANLLAAQRDLAGKKVIVHGRVHGSTLVPTTRVEAHRGFGPTIEAQMVTESVPMVLLEPGSVQCYFRLEHIDDAANLHQGQEVALACEVYSFQPHSPEVISVLSDCRRTE